MHLHGHLCLCCLHEGNEREASKESLHTLKMHLHGYIFGVHRREEVGLRGWCYDWVSWMIGGMPATKNVTIDCIFHVLVVEQMQMATKNSTLYYPQFLVGISGNLQVMSGNFLCFSCIFLI